MYQLCVLTETNLKETSPLCSPAAIGAPHLLPLEWFPCRGVQVPHTASGPVGEGVCSDHGVTVPSGGQFWGLNLRCFCSEQRIVGSPALRSVGEERNLGFCQLTLSLCRLLFAILRDWCGSKPHRRRPGNRNSSSRQNEFRLVETLLTCIRHLPGPVGCW